MMKGYKGFDKNLRCRNKQYKVGRAYETKENIAVCAHGFHFCERLADVQAYYPFRNSRVCEVEALGRVITRGNKSVTNRIRIIRELSKKEIRDMVNTGRGNTGFCNTGVKNRGDMNTGYGNSGDCNTGSFNSGRFNAGDGNTGDRNLGRFNSGNGNSGNKNSGYFNTGDGNSGNGNAGFFNSCNFSAGVFMSRHVVFEAFNKQLAADEFNALISSIGYETCQKFELLKYRIKGRNGEKTRYFYSDYKTSWRYFWNGLSFDERMAIRRMPHFDKDVFFEITGVKA
jgi:hypothetical protein